MFIALLVVASGSRAQTSPAEKSSLRTRMVLNCREDVKTFPDSKIREKYCSCIEAQVNRLADKQIADDSMHARKNYEARVAALAHGETPPPVERSAIDNIEQRCRIQVP